MNPEEKGQRTEKISVKFKNGYADGWSMAVGECFKAALDIKRTVRKKDGKQRLVETEGVPPLYKFGVGDTLYSTKKAYLDVWSEAVPHIDLAVQVLEGSEDRPRGKGKENGYVRVQFMHPSKDRTRLELGKTAYLSQDAFVLFLKTGRLPDGMDLNH